jgi:hypothetical protein
MEVKKSTSYLGAENAEDIPMLEAIAKHVSVFVDTETI